MKKEPKMAQEGLPVQLNAAVAIAVFILEPQYEIASLTIM